MNILKSLAQKAKNRLRAISNEDEPQKEVCLSARVQYALIVSKKRIEDDPLYNKVKKLMMKNIDNPTPLHDLIDEREFNKLDQVGKEKYIFNLSKRYREIKSHIESSFKEAI